jgi:hypothetical protein
MPFGEFFSKRINTLIRAYVVFAIIGFGQFSLIKIIRQFPDDVDFIDKLGGILYGSGTIDGPLQLSPVVLWFFPALITGQILFFLILKIDSGLSHAVAAVSLILAIALGNYALPWELESGFLAAFFLFVGYKLRPCFFHESSALVSIPVGVVAIVLGAYLAFRGGGFDFRTSDFGILPLSLLSLACTLIGIYSFVARLPGNRLVERVSESTLIIFPLHTIAFGYFDSMAKRVFSVEVMQTGLYNSFKCIVVVLVLTLSAPILLRLFGLGRRKAEHDANMQRA